MNDFVHALHTRVESSDHEPDTIAMSLADAYAALPEIFK